MGNNSKNSYPKMHFAAKYGWLNDPNGLVYHDGIYELYYQANPKGVEWADMTWGHARSKDLINWEELEPVMYPDENGMMFSGCGLQNTRKVLGLDEKALLFPYTAAFFDEERFEPYFTIRLAYSTDGGMSFVKKDGTLLKELGPDNRDPKVFWHEASKAFIMVLWIEKYEMGIFRSEDFQHFELSSRFFMEGGYECPDLAELPVSLENGENAGKKWIFWGADGSYVVGDFDGFTFTPLQQRLHAYADTKIPYAAQTWSGDPKGRVLQIAWLRTKCVNNQTTGVMSLPRELSLIKGSDGYVLKQSIPEEILSTREKIADLALEDKADIPEDTSVYFHINKPDGFKIRLYSDNSNEEFLEMAISPYTNALVLTYGSVSEFVGLGHKSLEDLDIVYDAGIVEVTTKNDTVLGIADLPQFRGTSLSRIEMAGGKGSSEVFKIG